MRLLARDADRPPTARPDPPRPVLEFASDTALTGRGPLSAEGGLAWGHLLAATEVTDDRPHAQEAVPEGLSEFPGRGG